ncbi:MAG: hypothetical protein EB127_22830, partial [Alphaproteobacteria bacterium]|nr:hypothetical protein [Alphaproteobacteria bacterium]
MVRVAYCFYGQPRRLEEGYTTVQSLMSRHSDVQFDFFYHTWYDSSKSIQKYEASPWRHLGTKDLTIGSDILNRINTLYVPKSSVYSPPIEFDLSGVKESLLYKNTKSYKLPNINNVLSQLYSIQQVRNAVFDYVQKTNIAYDFVVLSRFDFLRPITINFHTLDNTKMFVSDQIANRKLFCNYAISNYSTFLNHANIYNNLNNLLNNYEVCALFKAITLTECHLNPEEIKL